jgi:hypothetical protein
MTPENDVELGDERLQATWTDGSPAPWEAGILRSGIQGIEGSNAVNSRGTYFQAAAVMDKDGRTGLARSRDGGQSWERVTLPVEFTDTIAYVQVDPATDRLFYSSTVRLFPESLADFFPGGFDGAEIAEASRQVVRAATGRDDGPGFGTTIPIGYSDDDGETWHVTQIGGEANGEPDAWGDLGTIFVGPPPAGVETSGYPNVIYRGDITPVPSFGPDFQLWRSLDGGKSFHRPSVPTLTKEECPPVQGPGAPIEHPTTILIPSRGIAGPDGTVYLPISMCGQFAVGVSKDAGETFTWNQIPNARLDRNVEILAWEQENEPGCAGSVAHAGCPEVFQWYGQERLALDDNGTLYFIFNYHRLLMSISTDGGTTWTDPAPMSLPGVQTVWSSVAAQGNGRVGLSYLGRSEGSKDWHGYMAVVDNAADPSARTIATARVSAPDDPLMPCRCCGSKKLPTPEGSPEQTFYNLIEHGGLKFGPDGTLWAAFFRDNTRDPDDTESAAYEIVAGHMAPIGAG